MKWGELEKESCSMARALSVIGDRWTLLILRDCFLGVRRFDAFHERLGITRGVLADRLKQLTDAGVLKKVRYRDTPPRFEYRLTSRGLDLHPVILSIVHWGDVHMAGPEGRPVLHRHETCGHLFDPVLCCSECGEIVRPHDVRVQRGPGNADDRNLPVLPTSDRDEPL